MVSQLLLESRYWLVALVYADVVDKRVSDVDVELVLHVLDQANPLQHVRRRRSVLPDADHDLLAQFFAADHDVAWP